MAWTAALMSAAFNAYAQDIAAPSEVSSAAPEKVAVTIYRDGEVNTDDLRRGYGPEGLVLVRESRLIDLPAGLSRVKFSNVADRIVPQTAALDGLPAGAVERNFDYDLMAPGSLLEKSIGAPVRLVRTNPKTGAETTVNATIRTAPQGVVLETADGAEALHCSGMPERLVFDQVPEGLTASPTLSVLVNAPKAGRYPIRLSYLAQGLVWSADYVARVAPDGRTLDLSSWITIANRSVTTFADAPVEVVAGKLNRVGNDGPQGAYAPSVYSNCWPINSGRMQQFLPPAPPPPPPMPAMAAEAMMARAMDDGVVVTAAKRKDIAPRDLGDYKLYELPEPTRVAAKQIKQVQFIDRQSVPFERIYRLRLDNLHYEGNAGDPDQRRATTSLLRVKNDKPSGLGLPLPEGKIAIYDQSADGTSTFAGGDKAKDVPVGLPWDIEQGKTNAVSVFTRVVADKRVSKTQRRVTLEVEMQNTQTTPVNVELALLPETGMRIASESKGHRLREGLFVWPFALKAGATTTFRYTLQVR